MGKSKSKIMSNNKNKKEKYQPMQNWHFVKYIRALMTPTHKNCSL